MLETIIGNYKIFVSEKSDGNARYFNNFYFCKQTHNNQICFLDNLNSPKHEADAIITESKNIKIGVLLADCNGVVIVGKRYFAVVHAGRKGLCNGIIQKTISTLKQKGENPEYISVYVGPSIRSCCYQVGPEFKDCFDNKYLISRGGSLYLDMISVVLDILSFHSILQDRIIINSNCTKCSDKFFSYRNGDVENRFVVGIESC